MGLDHGREGTQEGKKDAEWQQIRRTAFLNKRAGMDKGTGNYYGHWGSKKGVQIGTQPA